VIIDADDIAPTVTWGTSPQDAIPIDGIVPRIDEDGHDDARRAAVTRGLEGGTPIEKVFIGS